MALKPADPTDLANYAAEVSTPGSPLYRHFLPKGAFARAFGPSQQTVHGVESALRSQGLSPGPMSADHLVIPIKATAGALEQAFSTGISRYRLKSGRVAFANTSAPELPAFVASNIQALTGLDTLVEVQPTAVSVPPTSSSAHSSVAGSPQVITGGPQPCSSASGVSNTLSADKIASAYGLPGLYAQGDEGQGQTVAVIEGENNFPSDIAAYQSCYGTDATVNYVQVDGGPHTSENGSGEAALDIEQIIGLAPKAKITVYQSQAFSDSIFDDYVSAVSDDSAQVISTSWGLCEGLALTTPDIADEAPAANALVQAENSLFEEAAVQGQSVVASSGDSGSEGCDPYTAYSQGYSSELLVADPSSQPFVTGIGGTTLADPDAPSSETVWNSYGAGGGGISDLWPMPSYQANASSNLGVTNNYSSGTPCGATAGDCREVPDVSADADPYTGYPVYWTGAWRDFGGTSASAPLWAALLALTNASSSCQGHSVGFANPALYQVAASDRGAFNDITSGNNDYTHENGGTYPALPGYDMASGLGTPTGNLPGALCSFATPSQVSITSPSSTLFELGVSSSFAVTTTGSPTPSISETGTLPQGTSFVDNGDGTASISGAATQSGSFPVSLSASNFGATTTQSFTLVIGSAPAITSADTATLQAGVSSTFQMSASGTPGPSFSVVGGALPSGLSLTSTGAIVGEPAASTSGVYRLTVDAANGVAPDATQELVLTVDGVPTFTSATTATFVANSPGSFTVITNGAPVASLSETGSLPAGTSFTDNGDGTATLSGTPTTNGSFSLTLNASNSYGTTQQAFTVTVLSSVVAPTFTSPDSATFTAVNGDGYTNSFQFTATGSPAPSFSIVSGTLPLALSFTSTGLLSGVSVFWTGGTYPIVVEANNGVSPPAYQTFTLTVDEGPLIEPDTIDGLFEADGPVIGNMSSYQTAQFVLGQPDQVVVRASGFPIPTLSESGPMPPGMTFTDNGNGTATISGTPTEGGSFPMVVTASNGVSSSYDPPGDVALVDAAVAPAVAPSFLTSADPTIYPAAPGTGPAPIQNCFAIIASGFPLPEMRSTYVPTGYGDQALVGLGEPWQPATATMCEYGRRNIILPTPTISATNSAGSAAQAVTVDFSLTARNHVFSSLNGVAFAPGVYSDYLLGDQLVPSCASGYSFSGIPPGLLATQYGALFGVPNSASNGVYQLQIGCNQVRKTVTVYVGPPLVATASLPQATIGALYSTPLEAGISVSPRWGLARGSKLPAGLILNATTGLISGRPSPKDIGTYTFTVTARVGLYVASKTLSIAVTQLPPTITSVSPATGSTAGGAEVFIHGTNLEHATAVAFGSVPASSYLVNGLGTLITAYSPAQPAGPVQITVTTPTGSATSSSVYTYS